MNFHTSLIAILTALLAGLCTGLGGILVLLFKRIPQKMLSLMLGFSAGIMLYLSFIEIFEEAQSLLVSTQGVLKGKLVAVLAFFLGALITVLIHEGVPEPALTRSPFSDDAYDNLTGKGSAILSASSFKGLGRIYKTGVFTALAVTLHNFPEGMAAYISGIKSTGLGTSIALAIAIHNVPEGVAIAVPVYYATGSRKKAFSMALLSGLSEPVGALLTALILGPVITDFLFGVILGAVAGIMVIISIIELLPAARESGGNFLSVMGLLLGMAVMAASILFLGLGPIN